MELISRLIVGYNKILEKLLSKTTIVQYWRTGWFFLIDLFRERYTISVTKFIREILLGCSQCNE
jgi:hypothetical protein